jgi:hypothetical protein
MVGLDMLAFLFGILGGERYTPLRGDESCEQAHEGKGVRGNSVVHAGIAAERKLKERKEIGINTENTEGRGGTERSKRTQNCSVGVLSRIHDSCYHRIAILSSPV